MKHQKYYIDINGRQFPCYSCGTVIVGNGAAGLNAGGRLLQYGYDDVILVTENKNLGTSRNAGSDKQTYYKLTLAGSYQDSTRMMAKSLMDGGCVNGDNALCEAALSAICFFHLVELGVGFPSTRYGEFVGYKTDHDPCARGSSSGPYTSRDMTMALENYSLKLGLDIADGFMCVKLLTDKGRCCGILCLNLHAENDKERFVIIKSENVIYACGGPGGIYKDSVYPFGQTGSSGIAFDAGAEGCNLTEWQYGLASVKPRWNVSGSYMQVLPRFISTNEDGSDPREFLLDYFSLKELLNFTFLKGYQWPFDAMKVKSGSSIIDILVYIEKNIKTRRIFLDFTNNPGGRDFNTELLSAECLDYLQSANAVRNTPIERLLELNRPAYEYYLSHSVDLKHDLLEISVCAQHNNGGLAVDLWWETNIRHLFAVGEVSGTHGVTRPGGSALNAGQVGSMRAAQKIVSDRSKEVPESDEEFALKFASDIESYVQMGMGAVSDQDTAERILEEIKADMSRCGSIIRNTDDLCAFRKKLQDLSADFTAAVKIKRTDDLWKIYKLHDTILTQTAYVSAMIDYKNAGKRSRGSAIYSDMAAVKAYPFLPDVFRFVTDDGKDRETIQYTKLKGTTVFSQWRPVRSLPEEDLTYETVWKRYREDRNVF